MSRIRTLSLSVLIVIAAILTGCTSSHTETKSKPVSPATTKDTAAAPTASVPMTTAAPSTTLPLILDAPRYQEYCSKAYPYCVEFPTVNGIIADDHRSYKAGEVTPEPLDVIDFMFGVELATGRVCTQWYKKPTECAGFDDMYYSVDARPMPNKTADQALSEWLEKSKQSMHALNYTTFAGSPAVTGQFGQLGTYTAFFHNGVLYEIATNGQEGRPYGEQRFLGSFRFTD